MNINKETVEAYGLATVGAIQGVYRYYKPELAWTALGAGIAAYDLLCEEGTTLSETFRKQPLALQIGELALVSSHLLGVLPKQADPFHQILKLKGR